MPTNAKDVRALLVRGARARGAGGTDRRTIEAEHVLLALAALPRQRRPRGCWPTPA